MSPHPTFRAPFGWLVSVAFVALLTPHKGRLQERKGGGGAVVLEHRGTKEFTSLTPNQCRVAATRDRVSDVVVCARAPPSVLCCKHMGCWDSLVVGHAPHIQMIS
jgi:hypothetical protein